MNFYESIAALHWTVSTQTDETFSADAAETFRQFHAAHFHPGQNLFALSCPELHPAEEYLLLSTDQDYVQCCLAVRHQPAFLGAVPRDSFRSAVIPLIKLCITFLTPDIPRDVTELMVPPSEKPTRDYYHDYWCARFGERHFRLTKLNHYSGDSPPSLVLAFPSADGGVWSSLLRQEKSGKYSGFTARQTIQHFQQSLCQFLPEILF